MLSYQWSEHSKKWYIDFIDKSMFSSQWLEHSKICDIDYIDNVLIPMVRALNEKVYCLHWQYSHANGQSTQRYDILSTLTMLSCQWSAIRWFNILIDKKLFNKMIWTLKDKAWCLFWQCWHGHGQSCQHSQRPYMLTTMTMLSTNLLCE